MRTSLQKAINSLPKRFRKKTLQKETLIETGTHRGDSARWASARFRKVYTIEKDPVIHKSLSLPSNVISVLGSSEDVLPEIINDTSGQILFWLDAHWSGKNTAGKGKECPLIKELEIITARTGDIILIDDARLFLSAPPPPHDPEQWPAFEDIKKSSKKPFFVFEDVIYHES